MISKAKRDYIYSRDGHVCVKCGTAEWLTIDHFIPKAHGGSDSKDNLQTLCYYCNMAKTDTYPTFEEMVEFSNRINSTTINSRTSKTPPKRWVYLKVLSVNFVDAFSLGLTDKSIGSIIKVNTLDSGVHLSNNQHFKIVTKDDYNLNRNHGTVFKEPYQWSWASYNASVESRANQMRTNK